MKNCIHYLTILILFFTASVHAQSGFLADNTTIIVNFPANTSVATVNALRLKYKATVVDSLIRIPKTYQWKLTFPDTVAGTILGNISALEGHIKQQSGISGGSANYATYTGAGNMGEGEGRSVPLLTALNTKGSAYNTNLYFGNACQNCWTNRPQTAVKVAQFDTGFDPTATSGTLNPFLRTYLGGSFNFLTTSNQSVDNNGHGTFVFGIMAQMANYWGLNNLKIYPYKTQDVNGKGSIWGLCKAFDKAVSEGINIVNLSVNFKEKWTNTPEKNTMYCIIKYVGVNHKILVINSAGNDNSNINLPKIIGPDTLRISPSSYPNCPNLIAVSAVNQEAQLDSTFSNWQSYNNMSQRTLIALPGVNIRSVYLGGALRQSSGTSFSAPMATAYAFLLAALRTTNLYDYAPIKNSLVTTSLLTPNIIDFTKSQYIPNTCLAIANYRTFNRSACIPIVRFSTIPTDASSRASVAINAKATNGLSINAFPNPCHKSLTLDVVTADETTTETTIFNLNGQAVLSQKQTFLQGVNQVYFDVSALPNGIYNCVVRLENQTISQKFVKE